MPCVCYDSGMAGKNGFYERMERMERESIAFDNSRRLMLAAFVALGVLAILAIPLALR